jgi:hypothetical protein
MSDEARVIEDFARVISFSGFGIRICFELRHSDFVIYLGANVSSPATMKMFTKAISKKKSQPSRIS